jgi:general secretion pathway protein L
LSAFEDVFIWWARQMADLISPVTARLTARTPNALLAAPDQSASGLIRLSRRRNGRVAALGAVSLDGDSDTWRRAFTARRRGEPVVLSLAEPLLPRLATLPLAAEANLDRVLRYEMDRLTPFAVNDVFFTHSVLRRDASKGQVTVELAVIPRTWVAALLDRLIAAGAQPSMIEAPGPDGVVRRVPMTHDDPTGVHAYTRFGWIVCAGLLAAIIAVPLERQSVALADAADRIAELRPRVDQADVLRKRIANSTSGAGQITAARHQAGEALRTIALLTDLMPDDTFLTGLRLGQHRLTMEGQSAAATKLIGALAGEPRLKNPSFAAPVLRSEAGTDIFTIQVEFGS